MRGRQITGSWHGLLACILAGLCLGCSSDWNTALSWPPHAIAGLYWSEAAVGSLGTLALELERVEDSRVFNATLSSRDDADAGESIGVGTLGNEHLILNFDRGLLSDYYFEGDVALEGTAVARLEGQFIFPDQPEPLPVVFLRH